MTNSIVNLSPKQITRYTNRFIDKSSSNPFYTQPHQTSNHIIASNAHTALYIASNVTDESIIAEHSNVDYTIRLSALERILNEFEPTTILTLDSVAIASIIKTLKKRRILFISKTKTEIAYNKRLNEISLTIKDVIYDDVMTEPVFYRASHVDSDRSQDCVAVISTSYLLGVLMTQKESNAYTTLEMNDTKRNLIKFDNEVTKAVIIQLREY